jgi:hypothetical protein
VPHPALLGREDDGDQARRFAVVAVEREREHFVGGFVRRVSEPSPSRRDRAVPPEADRRIDPAPARPGVLMRPPVRAVVEIPGEHVRARASERAETDRAAVVRNVFEELAPGVTRVERQAVLAVFAPATPARSTPQRVEQRSRFRPANLPLLRNGEAVRPARFFTEGISLRRPELAAAASRSACVRRGSRGRDSGDGRPQR